MDGMCRIDEIVEHAAQLDMPALAITDHGVLYGVIPFYLKCKEVGIKPIIGCEMYVAQRKATDRESLKDSSPYHLILLAKNLKGYKNLIKLVSYANTEGFYYKPRVDKELLAKHSEGLIALSSCLVGEISRKILENDYEGAEKAALEYKEIFGERNFYLELQDHGLPEEKKTREALIELSKRLSIPLVATNDVHYCHKKQADIHNVLICIGTGSTVNKPKKIGFGTPEFYFKTPKEMNELFYDVPEAINNTLEIAAKCNLELELGTPYLPYFQVPDGYTLDFYLEKICWDNFPKRYPNGDEKAKERLKYELSIIKEKGYSGYFLIVWDIVKAAKERGIPVGPGRGSAAGSIVSYVLGITQLDPLKYGLLFERFLNPERVSMPDIDLDFCDVRREEVIRYVIDKYGKDKVAQIITFGTMAARAAIRDAGRALEIPLSTVDRIAKLVPQGSTINEAIANDANLREFYETDEQIRRLLDTARALEGLSRHASTHAAGVVIAPEPLEELVPLQRSTEGFGLTTQFDKDALEKVGLLKMDLLGLRTLTVVESCIENVAKRKGEKIELNKIPLNDKKTYNLLSKGETVGVFQLESSGMRKLLRDSKPTRFDDLITLLALYRPGPLRSGMVDEFIRNKKENTKNYLHPVLKEILDETRGVLVFQEQVMQIAAKLAGFTMGQAETLMRAMSKKKADMMNQMKPLFIEGAQKRGVKREVAEEIFDQMANFASYGFNKSHSAVYALLAYQTAYLKAHHPLEYMSALLTSHMENKDKLAFFAEECRAMNIKLLPPDINNSELYFSVEEDSIRVPLTAIKGVSKGQVAEIIKERERGGKFRSIEDFCIRMQDAKLTRPVLEALIKAGAFDSLGYKRQQLMAGITNILNALQPEAKVGQSSLFGESEVAPLTIELPSCEEYAQDKLLAMEKDLIGVYLSDHPLAQISDALARYNPLPSTTLEDLEEGQSVCLAGIITRTKLLITQKTNERMASLAMEDKHGSFRVVVFPNLYNEFSRFLQKDSILVVRGRVRRTTQNGGEEEEKEIIAEDIIPLSARGEPLILSNHTTVHIKVSREHNNRNTLQRLRELFIFHKGNVKVILHLITKDGEHRFTLGDKLKVKPTANFIDDISYLLGKDAIWLQ
ncbi:DNA polymerase III subunit alpha [bacterium]|nr:DNA polymerase III subunit alpha [bacterium]